IERIRTAAERARPHVLRSPLVPVEGAMLKLECLQPAGSFKVRGFFAAALATPPDDLAKGLITVSAGNAALSCAYVAHTLGVPCRVVMYDTAPAPKLEGLKPNVEVIGVQSDGYPMWPRVFEAGGPVAVKPETIADGTTAPYDARMFELLKELVDRWLVVPEPRLKSAIPELAAKAKVVAEG